MQIEGGDILRKPQSTLDDCGIRDGQVLLAEIVDKIVTTSAPRAKKPSKEEPKTPLHYVIRSGNPEEAEPTLGKSDVQKTQRVKQLRKTIQDDLGIKDKVNIKIYLNGEEVTDDKLTVEDAKLLEEGA